MDFDAENGTDGKSALSDLKAVVCPFIKDDVEFWFGQFEGQLEVIEVKSQWLKRIAVQRFLPPEIQTEVKSLLSLSRTAAGDQIYLKIKKELIELFGQKPEDAYTRAKNRVMTGKPSQLGKAIVNDLCKKDTKLSGCCCDDITWGMFREALPVVVRNHIAQKPFNKDTYKDIFKEADKVFDSNQGAEPVAATRSVASTKAIVTQTSSEVAAVYNKSQKKNKNANNSGQAVQNGNQGQSNKNQKPQNGQNSQPKKKNLSEDGLCNMHKKWKAEANFCSAPWGCKMKDVWKAPQ